MTWNNDNIEHNQFNFLYGEQSIPIGLSGKHILYNITGKKVDSISDVPTAIRTALRHPIDTPPLREIIHSGDKVAIIVSDITRVWVQSDRFLPVILNELNEAGIPDGDIFIVIALGSHRFQTNDETVKVCGQEACRRVAIYQHDCHDAKQLVKVGTTSRGLDVYLNKRVVDADKVILTGGVAYHLMAGYSGGRKSVLPGVASYDTIQNNHRFNLHPQTGHGVNPYCGAGILDGNEMNSDMMEAVHFIQPDFILNAVYAPDGSFAQFFAGHWISAWNKACVMVREIYSSPIHELADVVIASAGGYPRDINFYQSMKPLQNAGRAAKEGGVVIMFMECRDILEPASFSKYLHYDSVVLESQLRRKFDVPGFVALKGLFVAKKVTVILVTKEENAEFILKAGMIPVTSGEAALAKASEILRTDNWSVTVMTHAGSTVPVLTI